MNGDRVVPLSAKNVSVIARGRVLPSGNLSVGPVPEPMLPSYEVEINAAGTTATINMDRIDNGATITLTYNLRGQDTVMNDTVTRWLVMEGIRCCFSDRLSGIRLMPLAI